MPTIQRNTSITETLTRLEHMELLTRRKRARKVCKCCGRPL